MEEIKNTNRNESSEPLVKMRGIVKKFPGTLAINNVDFDIYGGEVHVLAGENGAGKSTLIKILSGVHSDYEGKIYINGKLQRYDSPLEANKLGIVAIYQELSLVPTLSVSDNMFLGRPQTQYGFIKENTQKEEANVLLKKLGLDIDVSLFVEKYPISVQQLIEIAKALSIKANVIIMDEPTSALDTPDVRTLFQLIAKLKAEGIGIVYITHKMEEIEQIADKITVLRDGSRIGTDTLSNLPVSKVINWMVGRKIENLFPKHISKIGEPCLEVEDYSIVLNSKAKRPAVDGVSFKLKKGEVLGVAGLYGSGASELLMGLFGGYGKIGAGKVKINGKLTKIVSPRKAINNQIALLTSDRKTSGLILSMNVKDNIVLPILKKLSFFGFSKDKSMSVISFNIMDKLKIKAPKSFNSEVNQLSGGNQQKVVLAKWLQINPSILLLNEPTRGVDIGSKQEIYSLINDLTEQGIAVLLITSELPELLAMSDRIIVMHRGSITAEFDREDATSELILEAAMGKQHIDT